MKTPRIKQREAVEKAVSRMQAGKKSVTLILDPGYGKTLCSQLICNELSRLGFIDGAVAYVPRSTLTSQYELDWKGDRSDIKAGSFHLNFPWIHEGNREPAIGDFLEVPNTFPLISHRNPEQFGAVCSYSALCANPDVHIRQFKERRLCVIFDEAQQLGVPGSSGYGTHSAQIAQRIADLAQFVIIMTGTEVRTDGKFLLPSIVNYEKRGPRYYLVPDVEARYDDAVSDGYLRPFTFSLTKVRAEQIYADRTEEINSEYHDGALKALMKHEGTWKPLVDEGINRLKHAKSEIHPRLCSLITAVDQEHARAIHEYIDKKYPLIQPMIAVSGDGEKAKRVLRDFKLGYHDVLVTVKMAHIGYSYKWLLHWVCCSHFRAFADLKQTAGRVLRMLPAHEVSIDKQVAHFVAPDDPRMRIFIKRMREHAERGLSIRDKVIREYKEYVPDFYVVDNVEVGETETLSLFPEVEPKHFDFHRHRSTPVKTQKDTLKELRARLQKAFTQTDLMLSRQRRKRVEYGTTASACKRSIGAEVSDKTIRTIQDIEVRLIWLNNFRAERQMRKVTLGNLLTKQSNQ